jgi:thiol-disulfide isomerase/thioredoxin
MPLRYQGVSGRAFFSNSERLQNYNWNVAPRNQSVRPGHLETAAHAGEPTAVYFWGVTCVPCPLEMPRWGELLRERPDLRLVVIHADLVPDEAKGCLRHARLNQIGGSRQLHVQRRFRRAAAVRDRSAITVRFRERY